MRSGHKCCAQPGHLAAIALADELDMLLWDLLLRLVEELAPHLRPCHQILLARLDKVQVGRGALEANTKGRGVRYAGVLKRRYTSRGT